LFAEKEGIRLQHGNAFHDRHITQATAHAFLHRFVELGVHRKQTNSRTKSWQPAIHTRSSTDETCPDDYPDHDQCNQAPAEPIDQSTGLTVHRRLSHDTAILELSVSFPEVVYQPYEFKDHFSIVFSPDDLAQSIGLFSNQ
jgi:hypothetical protein